MANSRTTEAGAPPADRRSGKDRRQVDAGPPGRHDRRRDIEPRQPEAVELEPSDLPCLPQFTPEEQRWRIALDNGVFGLWDLHPRSEMVHYSPQWKARLGFGRIESPDSTSFWRSRVHPEDFNRMLRALRLHLDGYTPAYEMRFRLRAGDFRYLTVQSRGRVIERDRRGDALRMIGTMVDLTQRAPMAQPRNTLVSRHRHDIAPIEPEDVVLLRQVDDLLDIAVRDGTR